MAAALAAFRNSTRATSAPPPVDFGDVRIARAMGAALVGTLEGAILAATEALTEGDAMADAWPANASRFRTASDQSPTGTGRVSMFKRVGSAPGDRQGAGGASPLR